MDKQSGPPKTPRWVKVLGIVAGVVILLAIAALAFGGEHGPGRHLFDELPATWHEQTKMLSFVPTWTW